MSPSDRTLKTDQMIEAEQTNTSIWSSFLTKNLELSSMLRLLGGGITIMAISLFLFQRWDEGSDLYRYGLIVGETTLLTILGFSTSRWLNEQKSARLFLTLSMVSITAVFTILASMIHSQVQWLPVAADYPSFAVWAAGSMDTLILLVLGSIVLLIGQSLISFGVLARPVSRRLSILMLLNMALLLLPVRDLGVTTLLVVAAAFFSIRYLKLLRNKHIALKTIEGTIACLIVLLPLLVMIGRGTYLYAEGPVAILSLSMLSYLMLRQLAQAISTRKVLKSWLEKGSLIPLVLAAIAACELLNLLWQWNDQWLVVVFGVILAGGLMDLSVRSTQGETKYINGVFYTGLLVAVIEMMAWPGLSSALIALTLSGVTAVYGYDARNTTQLRLSLVTVLCSLGLLASEVIGHFNLGSWFGMSIMGMSIIVMAAAVERHGDRIKLVMERLRV